MAARKARKRSKTKAVTVAGQNALALPAGMEDEFAKHINRDKASATAAGWPYISTQGSTPQMTLSGAPIGCESGPAIRAVVLGAVRMNQKYEGDFVPGKPTSPTCYAIADVNWEAGEVEGKLAPPADLKSKADASCASCRFNAFGSGKGNAKECKNVVRLALLPAPSEDYAKADGIMLSVPPGGMKKWGSYVAPLAAIGRPVMTVITEIEKMPSEKGAGFTFDFSTVKPINDKPTLLTILARAGGDGIAALLQPPPAASEASGGKRQRRRKVIKKGVSKKKGARRKK
jgi:hypothetical protein